MAQGKPAGRAVSNWQPIETAPKDGTIVLGCSGTGDDYEVYEMAWIENVEFTWTDPHYGGVYGPTHWMPRPRPPAALKL
jgi:hypothetical protein